MHLDLPYLALCMLFNLIPVPPYARKADATPSMQPPPTHLPTHLPTLPPSFYPPTKFLGTPHQTIQTHSQPSHRKACIPGADFSKQAHSFALPPLSLGAIRSPSHLSCTKQATPRHTISAAVSKANIGPERSEAFVHACNAGKLCMN